MGRSSSGVLDSNETHSGSELGPSFQGSRKRKYISVLIFFDITQKRFKFNKSRQPLYHSVLKLSQTLCYTQSTRKDASPVPRSGLQGWQSHRQRLHQCFLRRSISEELVSRKAIRQASCRRHLQMAKQLRRHIRSLQNNR
jgi:hypothetical protein